MQKLRVKYQDGRVIEVFVPPKAIVMVERHYNLSMADAKAHRYEHTLYLAWQALFLAGREPNDFDRFLSEVEDFDDITEDGPDPTGTAPTPETEPTPTPPGS